MIKVTRDDFDLSDIIAAAQQGNIGAIVSFHGIVRDDGIEGMDVEAFEEVAEKDLQAIAAEAETRFGVAHVDIIHRVGHLSVGDSIVLIVVGASHRKAAFLACEYIIDRIKEYVPIWKKEYTHEGTRWVQGGH
ncbi:MAG: molybdenum cofactor biosynthesis protein MoaE [Methanolinea sp.]|nr:molybdenum cofactor biosynthesis protein MoaE [Methanolinea sp.]